jgi:hypothetical protein
MDARTAELGIAAVGTTNCAKNWIAAPQCEAARRPRKHLVHEDPRSDP